MNSSEDLFLEPTFSGKEKHQSSGLYNIRKFWKYKRHICRAIRAAFYGYYENFTILTQIFVNTVDKR